MCYSAQIEADYRRFVHEYGAIMSLDDFTRMVVEYFANPKMRVPKAMTAHFLESPETDEEKKIAEVTQPTQPTQPAQPAAVNWTTRGTRATPVQPGTSIASNAGAKWDDYTPPARYAGVAKQATQYITMPDGTKLAAYVTLPADASGKAATGTFPEADVWISSTALDAGVSVRIDDVDAAGNVTPHTDGLQTASLRAVDGSRSRTMNGLMIQPWHPFTTGSVQPIVPGQAVMVPVEVFRPAPSSPKATSCA